ncbi:MAG: type II toxin-antitoxin system VapB family antitoxin [Burkholderiales bacterium]|nr:type II toxin-antitoxin system VapB family antitoxin [Nitrosomonas sp.]MCP5275174.1 type II toxin-antitoxin system VapB family antitoxin [Burkholderiales bacterium]
MALNIRNSETEHLANELSQLTGETKTEAVRKALSMRLQLLKQQKETEGLAEELNEIAKHCAKLPVLDKRSEDEILYDKNGLPL